MIFRLEGGQGLRIDSTSQGGVKIFIHLKEKLTALLTAKFGQVNGADDDTRNAKPMAEAIVSEHESEPTRPLHVFYGNSHPLL